ncbi:uncharacterized protein LOC133186659 [Saccostrea echinata]|uniref:uncharacterized protein LOC133186659 n=1 Tax=Saccostrea echinata TaxID=191078 RepID=UPI002A83ACEB|nr:uncharacterized protein LOC133186659 [Saccostrea echinata]
MTEATTVRYFIVKCANFTSLKTCITSEKWACRDRVSPPHPREILSEALKNGKVIFIYSVNNCHGWHGYAEMLTPPDSQNDEKAVQQMKDGDTQETKEFSEQTEMSVNLLNSHWHYFKVKWMTHYTDHFGEQCLSSKLTEDIFVDNAPLNQSRNWQEIPQEVGSKLCSLIDSFYGELKEKRDQKLQRELERIPPPFYNSEEISSEETWRTIVNKVEKDLGKVILACPFGSQRYNLSTPESDTDMFIVYQAKTRDVLGFQPPKQTIKNRENQQCDYTIHEVFRYSELLLNGDARCVETLFLQEESMVRTSTEWQELKEGRRHFLNRETLNKYLRDAQGSKGTTQLQKWCKDHPEVEVLPLKMCKLLYVIVRLLQNARDIVVGDELHVYRGEGTLERDILMTIRQGGFPVDKAWEIIQKLESTILDRKDSVSERTKECVDFTESWLLGLRHKDFI